MTRDAYELAAPLLDALIPVPGTDLGACRICHSSTGGAAYDTCYQCARIESFLLGQVPRIIPISLSREGGQLHHALRSYKDGRDARIQTHFALQIAGLMEIFFRSHSDCIGHYDIATGVPSNRGRTAFEAVTSRMQRFVPTYESLLEVADGTIGSHELRADRFATRRTLAGETVLIVDDTFTSGASVASATKVLRAAGARVDAVLVVGRYITHRFERSAELLDQLNDQVWNERECIVCRPTSGLTLF